MYNKKSYSVQIDKDWEMLWTLFPDKTLCIYNPIRIEELPRKDIKDL